MAILSLIPTWQLVVFGILMFFFLLIGVGVTWYIMSILRWPIKVVIFEDDPIRNVSNDVGRDRARLVAFGKGGEEVYYLKRRKKYKVGYGHKMGVKKIGFCIGKDGYWYNVYIGGLDKKLRQLGIVPPNRDMRMAQAAMQKGIENRYDERTFFEKWGVTITIGMLVLAILVQAGGQWINHREENKGAATELKVAETWEKVAEKLDQTLASLDNINTGGSGLRPA